MLRCVTLPVGPPSGTGCHFGVRSAFVGFPPFLPKRQQGRAEKPELRPRLPAAISQPLGTPSWPCRVSPMPSAHCDRPRSPLCHCSRCGDTCRPHRARSLGMPHGSTAALPHCVAMAPAEQPSAGLRPQKNKHNLSNTAFNSYFLRAVTGCVCPFLTVRTTPTPAARAASFMPTLYFSILQISTLFRQNLKHSSRCHSGQPDSRLETSPPPPPAPLGACFSSP